MKKTISELNEKTWYRLVKVIYILIFFLGFLFVLFVFYFGFEGPKTMDLGKTKISCHNNLEKQFTADKAGIILSEYNFSYGYFDYKDFLKYSKFNTLKIAHLCIEDLSDVEDVHILQRVYEIKYGMPELSEEEARELALDEIFKMSGLSDYQKEEFLEFNIQMFYIEPSYTYFPFVKNIIIWLIILGLFFEGGRRTFYYIILGTFTPKKLKTRENK